MKSFLLSFFKCMEKNMYFVIKSGYKNMHFLDKIMFSVVHIRNNTGYRSISKQLSKENHKFQYKFVEEKGNSRKFSSSIEWLCASFVVLEK